MSTRARYFLQRPALSVNFIGSVKLPFIAPAAIKITNPNAGLYMLCPHAPNKLQTVGPSAGRLSQAHAPHDARGDLVDALALASAAMRNCGMKSRRFIIHQKLFRRNREWRLVLRKHALAKYLFATIAVVACAPGIRAQQSDAIAPAHKAVIDHLQSIAQIPAPEWRLHAGDIPDGQSARVVDSAWQVRKRLPDKRHNLVARCRANSSGVRRIRLHRRVSAPNFCSNT